MDSPVTTTKATFFSADEVLVMQYELDEASFFHEHTK
jgi:hypothetical protein